MVGIIGPRRFGKTTMILHYIKENLGSKRAFYVSADDMYFSKNKLVDLADVFYKNAGNTYSLMRFTNMKIGLGN